MQIWFCVKILLFLFCFSESESRVLNLPAISSILIAMHHFPAAEPVSLESIFTAREGRASTAVVSQLKDPKTQKYYKIAADLLDWVFDELNASDEDDNLARFGVDRITSSSEEDDFDIPLRKKEKNQKLSKTTTKNEKSANVRQRRIKSKKNTKLKRKQSPSEPFKFKPVGIDYDESVEKASLAELKRILDQMKRDEEGSFGSKIFNNPLTSTVMSFGRGLFKTMYCGLTSKSSYCSPPKESGPGSIFQDVYYRSGNQAILNLN